MQTGAVENATKQNNKETERRDTHSIKAISLVGVLNQASRLFETRGRNPDPDDWTGTAARVCVPLQADLQGQANYSNATFQLTR
jgi:asparagine synthetase A